MHLICNFNPTAEALIQFKSLYEIIQKTSLILNQILYDFSKTVKTNQGKT